MEILEKLRSGDIVKEARLSSLSVGGNVRWEENTFTLGDQPKFEEKDGKYWFFISLKSEEEEHRFKFRIEEVVEARKLSSDNTFHLIFRNKRIQLVLTIRQEV